MSKKCNLIATVTLLAALNSPAVSGNWNVDAAGNWSTAGNWSPAVVPGAAAGDTVGLTFNLGAARTVTIDTTSRMVGTLNIGDPTSGFSAYTLAVSGGATLTFNNNGSGALLAKPTVANTAVDTISAPITLADALIINCSAAAGDAGSNSLTLSGVISQSGTRGVTKNGVGGVQFSAQNTYSGGTVLNEGFLEFGASSTLTGSSVTSGPFGTGTLTINGGALAARGANRTLHNAVTVKGNFALGASGVGNTMTLLGTMDLGGATRTITVLGDQHVLAGISNGGLIKEGSATLELTNAQTFSGDTRIVAASLMLSGTGGTNFSLQNSTVDMNAADAGKLSFRGSLGTVAATLGGLKGSRNINLVNSSSVAVALTVGNNGQSTTYSGALSGVGASLTKIGAGTLVLSGANTYDGATTISGGSLQLGDGGASGSLYASGYIQNDGTLIFNRSNAVVQGVDFGSAPITGSGNIVQTGSGTTTLAAANSYSGTTIVNSGKLVISSAQTGTGAITVANGAKLGIAVSGVSQLSPITLTLGTGAATTLEFDGVNSTTIAPINVGTLSVGGQVTVKINTGTFAASNSYPLIHWTGSGPLNASSFVLGYSPDLTADLSVSNSILYLNVSDSKSRQRILKVYLQAGQSNSDGRALTNDLPINILRPQADVPLYYYLNGGGANGDGTLGTLTTLRPGISEFDSGKLFGPELTFGRTLADYYALTNGVSTNIVTVAIIKYAHGNTSLVTDWAANGNATTNGDGPDLVIFQQVVSAGLSRLASAYPGASIELDGMIWTQGEADVGGSSSAANYAKNLTRFINDVRLTFATNQPYGTNLPFFLSRISANQHYMDPADPSYANCLVLRAGQLSITTNLFNVFMIDTDPAEFSTTTPYSLPGTHFDTQGQQTLGAAFGRSVIAALPPPVFQMPQKARNGWSLQFSGVSGTIHSVERAGSVTGPWTAMTNIVIDATGIANFADPDPLNPASFYRASRP